MKLLKEYYIRLDTKWSATHCKGSLKNTFGATCGFQASKVFFLSFFLLIFFMENQTSKVHKLIGNLMHTNIIPIGFHHVIHLMMFVALKFVFNHLPLHICTSFFFTLPRGRLILFPDSSFKGHIHTVGCLKTPTC